MIGSAILGTIAQVAAKVGEAAWARNSANHAYRQSVNSATHAHQWEVGDLKAAGLNPLLSANGGAGASAFMAQSPVIDLADANLKGEQSALARSQQDLQKSQAVMNYANAARMVKDMEVADQNIAESKQRQATGAAQQGLMTAQTAESMARKGIYAPQAKLMAAQALNQTAQASMNSAQATEIGLRNTWALQHPNDYNTNMSLGRGTSMGQIFNIGGSLVDSIGSWFSGSGGSSASTVGNNGSSDF